MNPLLPAMYDIVWTGVTGMVITALILSLVSIGRASRSLTPRLALVWALIVILAPILGCVAWFVVGRRTATIASN